MALFLEYPGPGNKLFNVVAVGNFIDHRFGHLPGDDRLVLRKNALDADMPQILQEMPA